jgi:hypothetical protein
MPLRSKPAFAVYSEECAVTAEQVQQWAAEDGYRGAVKRCDRGFQITMGAVNFVDGEGWHVWQVGL